MPVSDETYELVVLEDPEGMWELDCGRLRQKPPMTTDHNLIPRILHEELFLRLGRRSYIFAETARLRISGGRYYLPDLCVIPRALVERNRRERRQGAEIYAEPLPLVVEVWSPKTGDYDVEEKLREYQRRGNLEIWRIHPYQHTLTAWRWQSDGSYSETQYTRGKVPVASLPGVEIDLGELFQ